MKKLIISFFAAVIFVVVYYATKDSSEASFDTSHRSNVAFEADDNVEVYASPEVNFSDNASIIFSDNGGKALLRIDNESYQLNVAQSGSGSKYQSEDGSIVFIEHQGTFMVEKNGEIIIDTTQ